MSQTETDRPAVLDVIPSPSMEIPKRDWDNSCAALDQDAAVLPQLRAKAESIKVVDEATYAEMGAVLTQVRLIKQAPLNRLGWVDTIIKRARGLYDQACNRVKNECTMIEDICKKELKTWEFREAPAAKAEEKQTNKARAKDGLPPVEVKPNIPKIEGYRRSTTYKATFDKSEDFDKMLRRFFTTKSRDERTYLRKFMTWDEKELNAEARDVKDPKELMKRIPGVRAWAE